MNISKFASDLVYGVLTSLESREINLTEARNKVAQTVTNGRRDINSYRYISPSQFENNFCLRRVWLAWNYPLQEYLVFSPNTSASDKDIFGVGTALHTYQSEEYATHLRVGDMKPWGRWKCSVCGQRTENSFKPSERCPNTVTIKSSTGKENSRKCSIQSNFKWIYEECPARWNANKYGIHGTADLVLKSRHRTIIVDYKYVNDTFYQMLKKYGNPPNKWYTQQYLYKLALGATEAYVEIHHRDPDNKPDREPLLFPVPPENKKTLKKVLEIKKFIDNIKSCKTAPLKTCGTPKSKLAKKCPFRYICFHLKEFQNE